MCLWNNCSLIQPIKLPGSRVTGLSGQKGAAWQNLGSHHCPQRPHQQRSCLHRALLLAKAIPACSTTTAGAKDKVHTWMWLGSWTPHQQPGGSDCRLGDVRLETKQVLAAGAGAATCCVPIDPLISIRKGDTTTSNSFLSSDEFGSWLPEI